MDPDDPGGDDPIDPDDPVDPDDPGGDDPVDPDDPGGDDPVDPDDPGGDDPIDPDDPGGDDPVDPDDPGPVDDPLPPHPGPGEAIFSEIMRSPDPTLVAARPWLEIMSLADGPRSLAGCLLISPAGSHELLDDLVFDESELLLIVGEASVSDDLPAADGTVAGLTLDATGELRLECDGVIVDAVDVTGGFPDTVGAAMQLDPGWLDPADNDNAGVWCDAYLLYGAGGFGTPGTHNLACDTEIDWCRTWYPAFMAIPAGGSFEVQAHVHEAGLTDLTKGAPDLLNGFWAQVGYGPDGHDPQTEPGAWQWEDAAPDDDPPAFVPTKDDRWLGDVSIPEVGTWDYATRFTADGGLTWKYCDLDGSSNGYSPAKAGHVTVN